MQKLQEKLDRFSKELQEDILEDYRQHFAEGELQGKTDEEIIEELGNIEDMIRELSESELKEDMGHKLRGIESLGQTLAANISEKRSAAGAAEDPSEGAERHRQEGSEQEAGRQEAEGQEGTGQEKAVQEDIGPNGGIYYSYSGKYEEIVLEGEEADIYVKPSPDDKIYVEYINRFKNGHELYRYYQHEENGVFCAGIKKEQGCSTGVEGDGKSWRVMLFGKTVISYRNVSEDMNGEALALCVSVPKGVPELFVNVSSGDVQVDDLVQERVQLKSSSGDVKVQSVAADTLKLNSSSGDVKAVGVKCCSRLEANVSSGDVSIRDVVLKEGKTVTFPVNGQEAYIGKREMTVCSSSGDVEIQRVTADKVSAKSSSGDVKLENVTAEEIKARSSSGDVGIGNVNCSGDLLAESSNGDMGITCVKAERLIVKTSEGDLAISSADFNIGDVESSRGDMALADMKFKSGDFSTSSGDMALANMKFTSGDFSTSSGDMAVADLQFETGDFTVKQGDIAVAKTSFKSGCFTAESGDIAGHNLNGEIGRFTTVRGDVVLQGEGQNHCREYRCVTDSGDISIEGGAEVYECQARSGDISVRAFGSPRKLKAGSSSGDVSVSAAKTPESVEAQSEIGDVHVKLEETEGMEVDIKTGRGDTYIKWNGQKRNVQEGCYTYGNGACKVRAFSGKGDVVVSGSSD